jgi:predicted esterase
MWEALERRKLTRGEGQRVSPPLFLAHGSADTMINKAWGESTRDGFRSRGADVEWFEEKGLGHELGPKTLDKLESWLLDKLK